MGKKSFIHPVAKSYFDKIEVAGGAVSDKNIINIFTSELSRIIDPSLWVCWPLRSTQNIGTGTTAFSLGSLGNFPGTLINGASWGADGITFDSSLSQYINIPFTPSNTSEFTIFGLIKRSSVLPYPEILLTNNLSLTLLENNVIETVFDAPYPDGRASIGSASIDQKSLAGVKTASQGYVRLFINGVQAATKANSEIIAGGNSIVIGALLVNNWFSDITSAFDIYFDKALSNEELFKVNDLYKQTLGRSLGLP